MLKNLRPRASIEMLSKQGTDIHSEGRIQGTLAFNHFTHKDYENLQEVHTTLSHLKQEMVQLFADYFQKLCESQNMKVSSLLIEKYIESFFLDQRDQRYVAKIIHYFNELRRAKFSAGRLIVVFNQFNYYLITNLLSQKGARPNHCMALMGSMQKAINIDQEILIEVYEERLMERVVHGISDLMEENAKIMFIKELIQNLDFQGKEIDSASAATEEMTASIVEIANAAVSISEKTTDSVKEIENGQMMITNALDEIFKTEKTFEMIVNKFASLQQNVASISHVVELINKIADQTNLLALNASIEAARAGEQGKGFAVVAAEVRKLAENTVSFLKNVNDNVGSLKAISDDVSASIEQTTSVIHRATNDARQSLPLLGKMVGTVQEIDNDINNAAAVSEEQAAAVEEVSKRMQEIAVLSENVRDLGANTGKAIRDLSLVMDQYRLEIIEENHIQLSTPSLLYLSKADHILWKWKIYNMFLDLENINPDHVASHQDCRLGKWYYAEETKKRFANIQSYRDIEKAHKIVHEAAHQAAVYFNQGKLKEAESCMNKLEAASAEVIETINCLLEDIERERQQASSL